MKPGQTLPIVYYFFPVAFTVIITFSVYFLKDLAAKFLYLFGFLFFLINISLCIQIVPMRRPAIMADRYMYLPVVGLIIIFTVLIKDSVKSLKFKSYAWVKNSLYLFGLVYITALIIIGSQMAANWQQHNLIIK